MAVNLTEDSQNQVEAFLRFAKFKRDQHVKEILSTIEDFQGYRVQDGEVYSTAEVNSLFHDLTSEVTPMVSKEVENAYHTNALLVQLLLGQAQQAGIALAVDTNQLENEYLISQIKNIELSALSKPASQFQRRPGQLQKIGTVATVNVADPQVVKERDQLKEELDTLRERFQKLQQQTTMMMREKSALSDELTDVKEQLATKDREVRGLQLREEAPRSSSQNHSQERDAAAQRKIEELQEILQSTRDQLTQSKSEVLAVQGKLQDSIREARKAEDALGAKVNDSKQFVQMKKMMQAKSQEVATLRRRLAKYEPQDIPHADETASEFD